MLRIIFQQLHYKQTNKVDRKQLKAIKNQPIQSRIALKMQIITRTIVNVYSS